MAQITDDNVMNDGPFLQAAIRLMLIGLAVMVLALTSLYFAPMHIAPFLSLGLYAMLWLLERRHGTISPVTVLMMVFYAVLAAARFFATDIAWSAYSAPAVYFMLTILVFGLLAMGRPFTMIYSRGAGFYPLHVAISLMWGSLHLMAGLAALLLMPNLAFLIVPMVLMLAGVVGTLVMSFVTLGPVYGRQKVFMRGKFRFQQVQTPAEYDLFYATIAEAYRSDLQRAAGPKRKIDKPMIEAEHRASDAKRDSHQLSFLVFLDDTAVGGICMYTDHAKLGLPVEHEVALSLEEMRSRGVVVEMGRLGILPRYRLERSVLTGLFKCVIEAAIERRVHTIMNDSFTFQVKLYSKIGFSTFTADPYDCEDSSTGYGLQAHPMALDLAAMVRLQQHTTTGSEVRNMLQPYVVERFFKQLTMRDLISDFPTLKVRRRSLIRRCKMSRSNTKNSKRRFLKMVGRTWLTAGVIAICYGLSLTSCAPVVDANGTPRINFIAEESGQKNDRLTAARDLWAAESGADGDPYSAGFAAYEIASVTHDPKWSSEAIARLGDAQEVMPDFAMATAWRGSAHALAARDFPLQGAWQVVPGPGFVRIYHVVQAEIMLNAAVVQAPNDPAVRLIRAVTLANMPAFFVDSAALGTDFSLLAQWDGAPDMNAEFADVLQSDKWRTDFYDAYATYLAAKGEADLASDYAAKLHAVASNKTQEETV